MMISVVFATLIAISVGSFLKLANHESRLSNIAFHSNSSLNLAEAGVEMALYALNHEDWTGWSVSGTTAVMDAQTLDLGQNSSGLIHARVLNVTGNPIVQAEGKMELPNRPSVTKQVEVRLVRRSLFANGITSRRGVTFKGGNATVDSYRSSAGPPSLWLYANNDNGSVASVSVEADAISISNAHIYGYVSTGGSYPSVGPNGKVFGKDTPSGGANIDPNRVALDFAADFPNVDPPSSYNGSPINTLSSGVIGTLNATVPTVHKVNSISVKSGDLLTIQGPVILHVLGSIDIKGEVKVLDKPGNQAVFYVDNDLTVGGNGFVNLSNRPGNLVIYGTNPVNQTIKLHGNGALYAAVYAPNATVEMKGGGSSGSMGGAVVANRVFINGNYNFHYDEDLADFGSDASYRMDKWRELHLAADRISF